MLLPLLCLLLLQSGTAQAVSVGQIDDFEDGTKQDWVMGFAPITDSHMTNITDGGPAGTGDNYLEVVSDGAFAAGGRLTFFNKSQWTGDYTAAGITSIAMDLKNFTPNETLNLRLGINNQPGATVGGLFTTSASVSLTSAGGWTRAVFSLLPRDLVPVSGRSGVTGNDVMATLANVQELRLLNSASPDWTGSPVVATLGIDNVRAVPLPAAALLFGSGLMSLGLWRRR